MAELKPKLEKAVPGWEGGAVPKKNIGAWPSEGRRLHPRQAGRATAILHHTGHAVLGRPG
jgi:hypothetical protein